MPRRSYLRKDWPHVVPRIFAKDARGLTQFIKKVLGATGRYQAETPTVLKIGSSLIMVSEVGVRRAASAVLYVYVPNCDLAYKRALAAGARHVEAPWDLPYGDRRCMVKDPWGNTWQIATFSGR